MRFNRQPITVEDAQRKIVPFIQPKEAEWVSLIDSEGRRLAESIDAPHPVPNFRRSGMDGFAVCSKDTIAGQRMQLLVVEEIACGDVASKTVVQGTCSRIMTGAALPEGADAVIKLEDTETVIDGQQTYTVIKKAVSKGENVTERGAEIKEGTPILEVGRRVGVGEQALLATFGFPKVRVFKQPTVAILSTGSELLQVDEELQPGKIRNSNSYMLAVQVKNAGAKVVVMDQVPDEISVAKEKILKAFEKVDVVITTGGVSVGDYDILVDIFRNWDGEMLFNKLKMRPGSPTTVGVRNNQFLFALSGNPGACFAGFELFVRPVLWGMQGKPDYYLPEFKAYLAVDFQNMGSFPRFVRGEVWVEDGKVYVSPIGVDQSSVVVSIKDTEVLIKIPPGKIELKSGQLVDVMKLNVHE
ncbi:molybdopterin molybdotransferase MoeA [Bacillus carboniphilus]|uniref:Molybdopterin molybdenumtransferase n=1 Tax=Bacillus carboniphilus TaxID=86663 RepID=A0ABP3FU36_9BACI